MLNCLQYDLTIDYWLTYNINQWLRETTLDLVVNKFGYYGINFAWLQGDDVVQWRIIGANIRNSSSRDIIHCLMPNYEISALQNIYFFLFFIFCFFFFFIHFGLFIISF